MYGISLGERFMKTFPLDTFCNITQDLVTTRPTELSAYGFIGKSAVIKYHQLASNAL